jgi:hypothetical protein
MSREQKDKKGMGRMYNVAKMKAPMGRTAHSVFPRRFQVWVAQRLLYPTHRVGRAAQEGFGVPVKIHTVRPPARHGNTVGDRIAPSVIMSDSEYERVI